MKHRTLPRTLTRPALNSFRCLAALAGMALALLAGNAKAANQYFDVNGTAAGYGTADGGSYSWDDPNWAAATGGTSATAAWTAGNFARFLGTGSYTATVNQAESMAGMVEVAGSGTPTLTINAAGSGSLSVVPNATLTTGLPTQGFFAQGGQSLVINAPITGTGGVNIALYSATYGNIYFYGHNTYSGGTTLTTSYMLLYYNNNNSFGTGPININNTTMFLFLSLGGAPITLANNWTNANGPAGIDFGNAASTPVTCSGPLSLLANNLTLKNNGDTTAPLTWSGVISGSGVLTLQGNNGGQTTFSGANTYTSQTIISPTGEGLILSVGSLNKVSGGSPSSNLGAPTTVANGTIPIGSGTYGAVLRYTGLGETTDRVISLAGTTGGATLQNDGSGALNFTSDCTATVAGAKTLTLQGANTAPSTISGKIVDSSSGATAVVKAGAGKWKLGGVNTYTGGTTVNQGTLEIAGSVAGSVTNTAGVLTLDSASTMAPGATLSLNSGSTVNLSFSGTNAINTLIIDGNPQVSGVWGAPGSTAPNQNAIFAGTTGFVNVLGKPVILQQPVSGSVFPDTTFAFNIGVAGDLSTLTYQWKRNGVNLSDGGDLSGSSSASLTISPAEAADAGTYSCAVTNAYGFAVSSNAFLLVLGTNGYTQTVLGDSPIAYWRLDEPSGTLAYDAVGGNNGTYNNASLNQPGYSVADTDPAIGVPNSGSPRGYMQVNSATPFLVNASSTWTFEVWANFTNLTTKGRLFSTLSLANPNGYAFGVLPGGTGLEFTAGAVADNDVTLGTALVPGQWYHLACVCDGNNYYFYVNGAQVGSPITVSGHAVNGTQNNLTLGANPPNYTTGGSDGGAEQVYGRLDEAAFYNYPLSAFQVQNHFNARYGQLVVFAPVAIPPTNYVSLSSVLQAQAGGQNLSYVWYKGVAPGGTPIGQTTVDATLGPLQSSDAGSYYVQVSNGETTSNSPSVYLAVLPIPTSAAQLNLTNKLVLHLPFDSVTGRVYQDISGRSNNGTNVGATTLVSPGAIGASALHYSSAPGNFNYVTLGVRPDLKFSSNVDFTVSYWIRQPASSTFTNLPFFGDVIGSTTAGTAGFAFAPYQTASSAGGWQLGLGGSIGGMSSPSIYTTFDDADLINDGNWHHLVHVVSRAANVTTYLDGAQVDSEADSFIGNMNNANAATVGQDPSGTYAVTASADIDDLAVWTRTLTSLEVSGIFLAGASNSVSFAPVVVSAPPPTPTTITSISGTTVSYTGGGGSQFVLLGTNNVSASAGTWPRLATNNATPGSFTIPAVGSSGAMFYRIKSE